MPKKGYRHCQVCLEWKTSVTDGYDPYVWEIFDEKVPMTACDECFRDRRLDV